MAHKVKSYRKNGIFRKAISPAAMGAIIVVLLALLVVSIVTAVMFGSASLTPEKVYGVIGYELFHIDSLSQYASGSVHDIVWEIRLPRVLLAMCVGAALSVCGVVMQAVVQNPLADPYTLGLSSGASLGATIAVSLGLGTVLGAGAINIMACLGALLISFLVLVLSGIGGPANTTKLVLAGVALSAICSAFSDFMLYQSQTYEAAAQVTFWSMGSLAAANWQKVALATISVGLGVFFFLTQFRRLNLMLLGEEAAITLGTNLARTRNVYLILVSVLVGIAVYCAGTIGFVGLIIPHIVRMVVGTDHLKLLPISALIGAIFLIWADVLCRTIIPNTELPIGILVSMIGAPLFIYMMVTKTYAFGGR